MANLKTIHVELTNLKSISSKMEKLRNSLNAIENTIGVIQSRTDEIWDGEAQKKFAGNSNILKEKTKKLSDSIQKNKQNLDEAVAAYERTELGIASTVNDLSAENIF